MLDTSILFSASDARAAASHYLVVANQEARTKEVQVLEEAISTVFERIKLAAFGGKDCIYVPYRFDSKGARSVYSIFKSDKKNALFTDSKFIRENWQAVLEQKGYTVSICANDNIKVVWKE